MRTALLISRLRQRTHPRNKPKEIARQRLWLHALRLSHSRAPPLGQWAPANRLSLSGPRLCVISYLFGACKFAFQVDRGVAHASQFDVVDRLAQSAIAAGSAVNCDDHALRMCWRAHAIAGLIGTIRHSPTSLCDSSPDGESLHIKVLCVAALCSRSLAARKISRASMMTGDGCAPSDSNT